MIESEIVELAVTLVSSSALVGVTIAFLESFFSK